jgi:hypothetical protein
VPCRSSLEGGQGPDTTETNRMQLVLLGMLNRTFGLYLAAIHRILIPVMCPFFPAFSQTQRNAFRCLFT